MKKMRFILPLVLACSALSLYGQEEQMPMMGMGSGKWATAHRQMHQEMVERWRDQDTKLDQLLRDVQTATGAQKVDALQALVTEMIAQRKDTHERMARMHERMMEMWSGQSSTSGTSAVPSATP